METKFIRALVVLGVPGVALGIFYLLLQKFNFSFSQVDATWTVVVVLVFLLIVGGITLFALHTWAPSKSQEPNHLKDIPFQYKVGEETVTYAETLTSLAFDVVKVNAHTHMLGVAAEYAWIRHKYPDSETILQSVTTLEGVRDGVQYKSGQIHFDVIKFRLPDGRKKEIYFDISSFFSGNSSSLLHPSTLVSRKLAELYGAKPDLEKAT